MGMIDRKEIYWFLVKLVLGLVFSTMLILGLAYWIAGLIGVLLVFGLVLGFGAGFYLGYAGKCWGVTFHKGGE